MDLNRNSESPLITRNLMSNYADSITDTERHAEPVSQILEILKGKTVDEIVEILAHARCEVFKAAVLA